MEVKLRCHVTSPALWSTTEVHTENISRSGLLIAWRADSTALPLPSVGQILTIDVELPANHPFGQKCIHCQGFVTRVTPEAAGSRVALRVNYMDFRSFHDRLRLAGSPPPIQSWMA